MKRPGRWRRIVTAAAALLGLLALLVVLAPRLAVGPLARTVERRFAEDRAGRLELGELSLAWTGRQTARGVRLVDPEGAVVAEGEANLPSLLELIRGGGRRLGRLELVITAELSADEEGATNLERALAARGPASTGEERSEEDGGAEGEPDPFPSFELELRAPRLSWSDPRTRRAGVELVLRDVLLRAEGRTRGELDVELAGRIEDEVPGRLELRAAVTGLARGEPATTVTASARRIATARIDALLAQEGLLLDVLGPTLDLELAGSWPAAGEPLRVDLTSPGASLSFVGTLEEGALVARGGQSLSATVPLRPLFAERVIGSLLPLMLNVEKPEGAAPVLLVVEDFHLPLDGDLARLDATVRLELGEVSYQLLPGIQDVLARFDRGLERRVSSLKPLEVRIERGVARYDRLAVRIADREVAFLGSYDLAARTFDLSADVPLALLGERVLGQLERVIGELDPETPVPVELSGTWKRPVLRIGDGFVERIVREAARDALSRGLRDLLEGR